MPFRYADPRVYQHWKTQCSFSKKHHETPLFTDLAQQPDTMDTYPTNFHTPTYHNLLQPIHRAWILSHSDNSLVTKGTLRTETLPRPHLQINKIFWLRCGTNPDLHRQCHVRKNPEHSKEKKQLPKQKWPHVTVKSKRIFIFPTAIKESTRNYYLKM